MPSSPASTHSPTGPQAKPSLRDRFNALRNLPPFLRQIWATSPALTIATLGLRVVRAFLPIATLYIGKLIIDSIGSLDRPVIIAYLMMIVALFVLINLIVDLLYILLDPRVRTAGGRS